MDFSRKWVFVIYSVVFNWLGKSEKFVVEIKLLDLINDVKPQFCDDSQYRGARRTE
jgi:hypothetical protein